MFVSDSRLRRGKEGPRLRRPPAALARRAAGSPPLRPGPREGGQVSPELKIRSKALGEGVAGPGPVLAAGARPGPAARALREPLPPLRAAPHRGAGSS